MLALLRRQHQTAMSPALAIRSICAGKAYTWGSEHDRRFFSLTMSIAVVETGSHGINGLVPLCTSGHTPPVMRLALTSN